MKAKVLFDCNGDNVDELTVITGDILSDVINSEEPGWYQARVDRTGQVGLVPATYIEVLSEKAPPPLRPRPNLSTPSQPQNQNQYSGFDLFAASPPVESNPPLPRRPAPSIAQAVVSQQQQTQSYGFAPPRQAPSIASSAPPAFMKDVEFRAFCKIFIKEDVDNDGLLKPAEVKKQWSTSGLDKAHLAKIWEMTDVDQDGCMSMSEFVIGMWLISLKVNDNVPVPATLRPDWLAWVQAFQPSPSFIDSLRAPKPGVTLSRSPVPAPAPAPSMAYGSSNSAKAANSSGPSTMEMFAYSQSEQGKQGVQAANKIAQSETGKKAGAMAWDNRDKIAAAAQSEQGKAAGRAAWENRDKVSKAAVKGASLIK